MRRQPRGFTMIELMVALVVSSLLVGMILSIFTRMSLAYRGQQQVAQVQQTLAAARAMIETDAKMVGLEMPQGFSVGADTNVRSPLVVINSSTGPDQIRFYYADLSKQAAVTDPTSWGTSNPSLTFDTGDGFAQNDLVVLATPDTTKSWYRTNTSGDAVPTKMGTCVVKLTHWGGVTDTFTKTGTWGTVNCPPATKQTMMYALVAHAYRIDPARPTEGVLQISYTGGLLGTDTWTDLGYGFTDLQVAVDFFDSAGFDIDGDGDALRNWYSSTDLTTKTAIAPVLTDTGAASPIQVSVSLVARTDRDVEGIATAATPNLTVAAKPAYNAIGDRASVTLPSATDTALQGSRVYRYTTFRTDLRNMGVGW